jgi:hypothetical protein
LVEPLFLDGNTCKDLLNFEAQGPVRHGCVDIEHLASNDENLHQ